MELRFIDIEHALYPEQLELRFRVLREPLGHGRAAVTFPFERESLHLIALNDQRRAVGCVSFHPEGPRTGRLFQMAVTPSEQGRGLGRSMARRLEAELARRGVHEVHLHARAHVVPFYERLGYTVYGEPFVEVSVPHRHMRRLLSQDGLR